MMSLGQFSRGAAPGWGCLSPPRAGGRRRHRQAPLAVPGARAQLGQVGEALQDVVSVLEQPLSDEAEASRRQQGRAVVQAIAVPLLVGPLPGLAPLPDAGGEAVVDDVDGPHFPLAVHPHRNVVGLKVAMYEARSMGFEGAPSRAGPGRAHARARSRRSSPLGAGAVSGCPFHRRT